MKKATLRVRLENLPGERVWQVAEAFATALDIHPDAGGPMVKAEKEPGALEISFEFDAVGDLQQDVERGLLILAAASDRLVSAAQAKGLLPLPSPLSEYSRIAVDRAPVGAAS